MSGSGRQVRPGPPAPRAGGVWAEPADDRRAGFAGSAPHDGASMRAGSQAGPGAPGPALMWVGHHSAAHPPSSSAGWPGSHRASGPGAVDPATPQYPVLLLNEEQVAQLLQRQAMRTISPPRAHGLAGAAYARLIRRARMVMAALLLISAGAGAWMWGPSTVLAAFPWTGADVPPAIATGASFSLTIASPRAADAARDLERRLEAAGTPAFVRTAAATHHVMAGPYVSLDEAETEQRRLSHAGFGGARIFVDDSLRKVPVDKAAAATTGRPAMVLVAAAHQLSLVFEFEREPRQVTTKRSADGTVLVEMGPIDGGVDPQEWSAPAGVSLLRQVTVEEIVGAPESRLARATLSMPRSTMALAQIEGRRVYVDLAPAPRLVARAAAPVAAPAPRSAMRQPASPRAGGTPAAAATAATAVTAAEGATSAAAASIARPAGGDVLRPVLARAERLVPFLQSAARTPAADVLRAVAANVNEIDAALRQAMPEPGTADAHAALTSALAAARRAVDAGFAGDRVAEAHQAAMLVEAAKTVLPAGEASPRLGEEPSPVPAATR